MRTPIQIMDELTESVLRITAELKVAVTELENALAERVLETMALKARIKDLEETAALPCPPPSPSIRPPFLLKEDFDVLPEEGPVYLIDAPPGHITLSEDTYAHELGTLNVLLKSWQPKDQNGRVRSEVRLRDPKKPNNRIYLRDPIGSVRWYAVSVLFSRDWRAENEKHIFMQCHASPDTGEQHGNPPFLIFVLKDKIIVRQYWCAKKIQQKGDAAMLPNIFVPLILDKWMRWVVNVRWHWQIGGGESGHPFTKVWLDGKEIVNRVGQNCYNDDLGLFHSIGDYYPAGKDREQTGIPQDMEHILRFQEWRIGDERHTLSDFT